MPVLSVIIPVYNVAKYIGKCARTLFEQSFEEIEYIFVDDCTPDNSVSIIEGLLAEYPEKKERVKIVRHSVNRGLSASRNTGLSFASGRFVAFCDSDDYVCANMYEIMCRKATLLQADIVYCNFYEDHGDRIVPHKAMDILCDKNSLLHSVLNSWFAIWNMIIKRDLFIKNKIMFPDGYAYREDFCVIVPLFYYASKVIKTDDFLYYYNKRNSGSILSTSNKEAYRDIIFCDLKVIDFLRGKELESVYQKSLAWMILRDKQDLVLESDKHLEFLGIYPQSHKYIFSCPFLNFKMKCLMWLLVHHMSLVVSSIIKLKVYINMNR